MKRPVKLELLKIGGGAVTVKMRVNPRARRLIVKVHPSTGEIAVVAPTERALKRALAFARGQGEWIAERLSRIPSRTPLEPGRSVPLRGRDHLIRQAQDGRAAVTVDETAERPTIRVGGRSEHAPRRVEDFLKREARRELTRRAGEFAAKLGVRPKRIAVRDSSSRWGSCSSRKTLSFSWRLVLAPAFVLDYVVAHEVAHLKEMNHGPRFWRRVESLVGERARAQAWLRENGAALHRYNGKTREAA